MGIESYWIGQLGTFVEKLYCWDKQEEEKNMETDINTHMERDWKQKYGIKLETNMDTNWKQRDGIKLDGKTWFLCGETILKVFKCYHSFHGAHKCSNPSQLLISGM